MKISLFLCCYNEEKLIEKTIKYYKSRFNNIKITIMDNYSTDKSCEIAERYNCNIIKWGKKNYVIKPKMKDYVHNIYWLNEDDNTWIITCDMDEYLDINFKELQEEDIKGTTIIKTKGYQVISNDIYKKYEYCNFYDCERGYFYKMFSKNILFKKGNIKKMNFKIGMHSCNPIGNIIYSKKIYILYHFNFISLNYYVNRHLLYQKRHIDKKNYNYKNKQEIIDKFMKCVSNYEKIIKLRNFEK